MQDRVIRDLESVMEYPLSVVLPSVHLGKVVAAHDAVVRLNVSPHHGGSACLSPSDTDYLGPTGRVAVTTVAIDSLRACGLFSPIELAW